MGHRNGPVHREKDRTVQSRNNLEQAPGGDRLDDKHKKRDQQYTGERLPLSETGGSKRGVQWGTASTFSHRSGTSKSAGRERLQRDEEGLGGQMWK